MKLVLTRGLPACGKTMWADEVVKVDSSYVNVNRDDLRLSLTGRARYKKFQGWRETIVSEAATTMVGAALTAGKNVIVSDTNLNPDYWDTYEQLAEHFKAEFCFKDFFDVPYGVCIERDAKREFPVGQAVIEGMFKRWQSTYWPKPVWSPLKQDAFIFDLDGTLADIGRRWPHDASKCREDGLYEHVSDILSGLQMLYSNAEVIFCSGREDTHEDPTRQWIEDALGMSDGSYQLFMRGSVDTRKDHVIKEEIYDRYIAPEYNVRLAVDDRNQIVHMWRHRGIPTIQVNYGYF